MIVKDQKYQFVEDDITGESTLNVVAKANKFNQWMYKTISDYCKGEILEIGSGVGNISAYFLKNNYKIHLSDIRKGYCDRLQQKFGNYQNLLGVECMDLVDENFDAKFSDFFGKFDTIFALNVIEHIHDDVLALKNCKKLLTKGGKMIVLVPSYQFLFSQFDVELGHYRRYNKTSLSTVFNKAGFEINHKQYFNFIGMFGWFVTGKLFRKKTIPSNQMGLYNSLVPVFKVIDRIILNSMGLSTIIIGTK